jgi:hypothetical protein
LKKVLLSVKKGECESQKKHKSGIPLQTDTGHILQYGLGGVSWTMFELILKKIRLSEMYLGYPKLDGLKGGKTR